MPYVPSFLFPHNISNRSFFPQQVLGGIADTVAQTLTAFNQRQRQRSASDPSASSASTAHADTENTFFAIDLQDYSKKVPWPSDPRKGPPPFDFERLVRFMAYGFIMAPIQHRWFGFLERTFPIVAGKGTTNALRRVAFDQLLFAPCGMLSGPLLHEHLHMELYLN